VGRGGGGLGGGVADHAPHEQRQRQRVEHEQPDQQPRAAQKAEVLAQEEPDGPHCCGTNERAACSRNATNACSKLSCSSTPASAKKSCGVPWKTSSPSRSTAMRVA